MNKHEALFVIEERFLDHPYELAGRLIDPVPGTLSWQAQVTHLRRKELEVLALLASAQGAVVPRQDFIAAVWDGNDLTGDKGVSDTIFSVRRALHDDDVQHPLIRTVPRRGYQLTAPVQDALPKPPASFKKGSSVPGSPAWRLLTRLGESPVSEIWLAQSEDKAQAGQRVFRFCRSEPHLRALRREITLLRYLSDCLSERDDVLIIRDWQLDEPPYYLARDYTRFGKLSDWAGGPEGLARQTLTVREAMMLGLAEALSAVHAVGVIHCHLSADCIFVEQTNGGPHLKLGAFGLSALMDRSQLAPRNITAAGLTLGVEDAQLQPRHPAPEWQAGTELTMVDDVYALGVVLLQLACADLAAEPTESWLTRIPTPELQTLLRRCVGPAQTRPTAAQLVVQLRGVSADPAADAAAEVASVGIDAERAVAETSVPAVSPAPAAPIRWPANPRTGANTIGQYRLLDRLGEGGMGMVYLAERREPYRKVALKIIRAGLDGKQILSRFEAERQALAMMNHPNVATVLDSGLAEDGRPFFAMEYIAGVDIASYCDSRHLNLQARIKLFLQVCDGVLHAHQKGVLHRDIKPSNLMVSTAQESAGTVKVIDFGVAKSLHGKLAEHTLHTSFGAFIGTPIYSSPEHVSGSASGVDTRSDVYSMGVVLYELLAGMTPIKSESLENLEPEKVRELICKSKLPSMSEQLQNTSAQKRSEIAEQRAMKVDELPTTLDGDLSWVVSKCLERDPNERYGSVLELQKDLQRWLENRPVEARPITWKYRVRKMVRRNRSAVILGSAVTLALTLTTTGAIVGFVRSERALTRAHAATADARAAAEFQVKQLGSINSASMGMGLRATLNKAIAQAGKERELDEATVVQRQAQFDELFVGVNFTDVTLTQLSAYFFNPALSTIKKDYADHPELQASLWQSMADTLAELGQFADALEPQELALAQRQRLLGSAHPLTLQSLARLGNLEFSNGELQKGEADLRKALADLRRVSGNLDFETLNTMDNLGSLLLQRGQAEEAHALSVEALSAWRQNAEYPRNLFRAMVNVGNVRLELGDLVGAEKHYQEALAGQRRTLGPDDPETLGTTMQVAKVYMAQGKLDQALEYCQDAVALMRKVRGNEHRDTLIFMNNLAVLLGKNGQLAQAEQLQREILQSQRKWLGARHPITLITQAHLLGNLVAQGRFAEAEPLFVAALATARESLGVEDRTTLKFMTHLAKMRQLQGRLPEAVALLKDVLKAQQGMLGAENAETRQTQAALDEVLKL